LRFLTSCGATSALLDEIKDAELSKSAVFLAYDYAIIKLYRDFERLMLECIIAVVNNDTAAFSKMKGINFPKHLTDEVCETSSSGMVFLISKEVMV
jgi:hypothetical protein